MKKKNLFGIIVIGACVALVALAIYGMVTWIITQREGKEVRVTIIAVPDRCDRSNPIKVALNGEVHEVKISRADCRNGVYKVGQQITLMQHPGYKELVWPDSRPDIVILCIVGLCLLIFYQYRTQHKKGST